MQYLITVLLLCLVLWSAIFVFKKSGMFWVTKHCIYYVNMYLVLRNDRHLLVNVKCFYKRFLYLRNHIIIGFGVMGLLCFVICFYIFHHLIVTYVWASTHLACVWTSTHLVFVSVSSHFKFVSVLTQSLLVLH